MTKSKRDYLGMPRQGFDFTYVYVLFKADWSFQYAGNRQRTRDARYVRSREYEEQLYRDNLLDFFVCLLRL